MEAVFIQGLLLGYGASVPLGPINVLIMNYALQSYKRAFLIGLGAMSADITYLLLIVYGLIGLIEGTYHMTVISLFGGMFLLYIAFLIYKNRDQTMEDKSGLEDEPLFKVYLKGFTLTLLNPYTIGFWLSVTTLAEQSGQYSYLLLGLIVAIGSWIIFMPLAIYQTKHLFSTSIINMFSLFSVAILGMFGLILLYSAISSLYIVS